MSFYRKRKNPPIPRAVDDTTAEKIRSFHFHNACSYRTLAYIFNVHHSTVEHIIRRKGAYANVSPNR